MADSEKIEQLKLMLGSDLIRKRKAGIIVAGEILARGENHEEIRHLLEKLIQLDPIGIVKEAAQKELDRDDQRLAQNYSRPRKTPDYIFGAKCPNGHVSYFDKREYCPKQSSFTRRIVYMNGQEVDEILVKCEICGEEFYVEVSCEGYKEFR
jgi:hypothetical protein